MPPVCSSRQTAPIFKGGFTGYTITWTATSNSSRLILAPKQVALCIWSICSPTVNVRCMGRRHRCRGCRLHPKVLVSRRGWRWMARVPCTPSMQSLLPDTLRTISIAMTKRIRYPVTTETETASTKAGWLRTLLSRRQRGIEPTPRARLRIVIAVTAARREVPNPLEIATIAPAINPGASETLATKTTKTVMAKKCVTPIMTTMDTVRPPPFRPPIRIVVIQEVEVVSCCGRHDYNASAYPVLPSAWEMVRPKL